MGILKYRVQFFRRKTAGTSNGLGTFFLEEEPKYTPDENQTVVISHTKVAVNSGLLSKLDTLSTNTVTGKFQSFEQNTDPDVMLANDNFSNFFIIKYDDLTFSSNQFSGDCSGYIEFDVDPDTYQVLKPIESAVIVSEKQPYDLDEGENTVYCAVAEVATGETQMPAFFIKRNGTSSVFTNILTSLNLPVSEEDLNKYSRSALGNLVETPGGTIMIDGKKYTWNETNTPGDGLLTGVVHPTEGFVGEHYGTVMQSIGMMDELNENGQKTGKLIPNDLYLILEIPQNSYGELIDGKTIKLELPYTDDSGTTFQTIEIYSTYNKSTLQYNIDRILSDKDLSMATVGAKQDLTKDASEYESNCSLLFSTIVKDPIDTTFTWDEGYNDLMDGVKVFNEDSPRRYTYDYRRDVCVGVAYLDKGFIVITHPTIVDNIFEYVFGGEITEDDDDDLFTYKSYDFNDPETSSLTKNSKVTCVPSKMIRTLSDSGDVEWESTQWLFDNGGGAGEFSTALDPKLTFISYNTEKSLNIVCLASADEFFKSTNSTAKELLSVEDTEDYASFKGNNDELYPVLITEIGIHDEEGNLLAICKPSQPIKKYWYDVVSFNIKIRL